MIRFVLIFLLFLSNFKQSYASGSVPNYIFIKNEGQWPEAVLFKSDIPGGFLWITKTGLEYQMIDFSNLKHPYKNTDQNTRQALSAQVIKYSFKNELSFSKISGIKPIAQKINYFIGSDQNKWKSNIPSFTELYITDVFEKIDFRIYGLDESLKYEYIVKPYAAPQNISLLYEGAKSINIKNKELILETEFGLIKEFEPFSFQNIGNSKKKIESGFKISNNRISFDLGDYDHSKELIIDPELVFSTYSGSFADNWSQTATYDAKGNLYAGGTVFGSNFPVSDKAFQTSVGGTTKLTDQALRTDIVITKYSDDGQTILYSTFLGGSDSDVPHSLIANSKGELVIFGTTGSNDFPVSSDGFDKTYNGGTQIIGPPITTSIGFYSGSDIFVAVLSENGSKLVGGTFVGGTGNDGLHDNRALGITNYGDEFRGEVFVDKNDEIYVASVSNSNNFPIINSSYKKNSTYDGVVFRLNPNCSKMLWSSFIGGSDYDGAYGIRVNDAGAIYVCGVTKSSDFPITSLALKKDYGGFTDGFLIKFEGNIISHATFLGTSEDDMAIMLDLDKEGNPCVFGLSSGDYPVSEGVYKIAKSGQFVHSLTPDLSKTRFASIFGSGRQTGRIDIVPTAFLINDCGNIYIAGWGGKVNTNNGFNPNSTTRGLPVTSNAFQSTTSGNNFYFAIFEKNFKSLLFGTFFGTKTPTNPNDERGDHLDGGTCRFDKNGIIYHSACVCKGNGTVDFPLKNAAMPTHNSGNCNMAAFKFNLDALLAKFDLFKETEKNPQKVCAPAKISFDNKSLGSESYEWYLNDKLISKAEKIDYNFADSGSYTIKLKAFNKITCKAVDSTSRFLKVSSFKSTVSNDTTACSGSSIKLKATGGIKYKWSPANYFDDPSKAVADVIVNKSEIFKVEISNGECTSNKEVSVIIDDAKKDFGISNNTTLCKGQSITLVGTGSADKFTWTATGMSDSTKTSISVKPLQTTNYTLQAFYKDGCKPKKSITVEIDDSVKPDFTYNYIFECNKNSQISIENKSTGAIRYLWQLGQNQAIETAIFKDIPKNSNLVENLILKAYSKNGCEFTITKPLDLKTFDGIIPNVITPNNDKKNDTFVVGYLEPSLEIFDQWGKKIFKSIKYLNDWGNNIKAGPYYYLLTISNSKVCKGWIEVIN